MTYYVGHETVISREDGMGLPAWQERIFAVMERNAVHVSDFFSLPSDQVVEIGRQVSILGVSLPLFVALHGTGAAGALRRGRSRVGLSPLFAGTTGEFCFAAPPTAVGFFGPPRAVCAEAECDRANVPSITTSAAPYHWLRPSSTHSFV